MSYIFDIATPRRTISAMSAIHELGHALRQRRSEMGLTQARVATLSGLSRQTVNQIEAGTAPDLGLNKAERLAAVLGLVLRVDAGRGGSRKPSAMTPLAKAAATASVSFKSHLAPAALRKLLLAAVAPENYLPHVRALLDEAPVSLLAAVIEQLHQETSVARDELWGRCRRLANSVGSRRDIWS